MFQWNRSLFVKPEVKRSSLINIKAFEQSIEKSIVEASKSKKERKKKSFAPSSFGAQGPCPRYWDLAFSGAVFDQESDALGAFVAETGIDFGDRLEKKLFDAGVAESHQKAVTFSDPPIFGFLDFEGEVVVSLDDNETYSERYVCDIKTTDSETFEKIRQTLIPKDAHLIQILIYMRILKLKTGILLYVDRNTGKMLSVPITISELNKKYVAYIFDWMKQIKAAADDPNVTLSRGFTKSTWQCKSCPVREKCWSEDVPKKIGPGKLEVNIEKWQKDNENEML